MSKDALAFFAYFLKYILLFLDDNANEKCE